jgi:hypothetical protein
MKTKENITLKTKSLYIGCYDVEGTTHSDWLAFVYDSNANDSELDRHFRNVVYYSVYSETLEKHESVDIFELREAFAHSEKTHYKVIVSK